MNRARPLLASIDDTKEIRAIIVAVGAMAGYDCIEAGCPSEIAIALDQNPDLIVLDMSMPEMDGFEVIKELARRKSAARLIILSGFDPGVVKAAEVIAKASNLHLWARLKKPIDVVSLLKQIKGAYPAPESLES
jgi:DNA-binding response OmpR family regulator